MTFVSYTRLRNPIKIRNRINESNKSIPIQLKIINRIRVNLCFKAAYVCVSNI